MDFAIRTAALNDYEAIQSIMVQVHALHAAWRPDIYLPAKHVFCEEIFQAFLKTDIVLVAEKEKHICAVMILKERQTDSPILVKRRILFVDSLAVDETYRGQGIGSELMRMAAQLAKKQGYDGLELQVNARNGLAKEFYEKLGFTEKSINMEICLNSEEKNEV